MLTSLQCNRLKQTRGDFYPQIPLYSPKKLYWYRRLGKIALEEEVFTRGRRGPEIRPFSPSAEVHGRGCWEALPRALTDLGAEDPFAGAARQAERGLGD